MYGLTFMPSTYFVKIVVCDNVRDWRSPSEENSVVGSTGILLPSFGDNLSVPSWRVKNYWLLIL